MERGGESISRVAERQKQMQQPFLILHFTPHSSSDATHHQTRNQTQIRCNMNTKLLVRNFTHLRSSNNAKNFLLEDPARIGLDPHESLSELTRPAAWKFPPSTFPKNPILKDNQIIQKPKKDIVEPYLEFYGRGKTVVFAGFWTFFLLPYCLGAWLMSDE